MSKPNIEDDGSPILTIELTRHQVERMLEGVTLEGDIDGRVGPATLRAMRDLVEAGEPVTYHIKLTNED